MMIYLSPALSSWPLPDVKYSKDALTINGELFDFGRLPEGASLPLGSINSQWFDRDVTRVDGEIHLSLVLPHGANPSEVVAFPEPIRVTKAGAVKLPFDVPPEPVEPPALPESEDQE